MYVFQLFDYYAGSRIILLVAFFECLVVAWIYGAERFYGNLEMMLGFRMNGYMKWCWRIVTPIFTIVSKIFDRIQNNLFIVWGTKCYEKINSGFVNNIRHMIFFFNPSCFQTIMSCINVCTNLS